MTDDRRQTDRQTDGRRQIANVNMNSRSLTKSDGLAERAICNPLGPAHHFLDVA